MNKLVLMLPNIRSRRRWENQGALPVTTNQRRVFRSPVAFRRSIPRNCKIVILLFLFFCVITPFLLFRLHLELAFYPRKWIKQEVETLQPLSGCFRPHRVSPNYNVTINIYGPKYTEVHPGIATRLGMDCYNFAGSIKPFEDQPEVSLPPEERTHYHTFWRTDLAAFGERQEWMLKSFFATQNTYTSRLVLWSNGDLSANTILQKWLQKYPDAFTLKVVDYEELAKGTELAGHELLRVKDTKAWIDGDLVRLLVMWAYGGVWIDMDSLLTRDLGPLLEHEFVTQWDCYGVPPFRTPVLFLHR